VSVTGLTRKSNIQVQCQGFLNGSGPRCPKAAPPGPKGMGKEGFYPLKKTCRARGPCTGEGNRRVWRGRRLFGGEKGGSRCVGWAETMLPPSAGRRFPFRSMNGARKTKRALQGHAEGKDCKPGVPRRIIGLGRRWLDLPVLKRGDWISKKICLPGAEKRGDSGWDDA